MLIECSMQKKIAPFFQHANLENPSTIHSSWTSGGVDRAHRVYKNCVSCNVDRFDHDEMNDVSLIRLGTNTYHCNSCNTKVMPLASKLAKENSTIFNSIWNNYLYGTKSQMKLRSGKNIYYRPEIRDLTYSIRRK